MSEAVAERVVIDRRQTIAGLLLSHTTFPIRSTFASLFGRTEKAILADEPVCDVDISVASSCLRADLPEPFEVAVRTIGGACPTWAGPSAPLLLSPLELVIARQSGFIRGEAGVEPSGRIVIIDDSLSAASLPSCAFAISGTRAELDILAEALARTIAFPSIIGIDFADIRNAATFRDRRHVQDAESPPWGRGFVLGDVCPSASSGAAAKACLSRFELAGFSGGVFIAVLIGPEVTTSLPDGLTSLLYGLDAFVTAVEFSDDDRPFAISAVPGASRDAIAIVAFGGASALNSST